MKTKTKTFIAILFTALFIVYSAISFVKIDLNFAHWDENVRVTFIFMYLIVTLFLCLLVADTLSKDE